MGTSLPKIDKWGVRCETDVLTDVLLCRPDHYRWNPVNRASRETLAAGIELNIDHLKAQYAEFEGALDQAGVRRHYLESEPHLPYQCYTRDSSQMTPWGVVHLMLQAETRRGEYASVIRFYEQAGIPVFNWATRGKLEGGDIHLVREGLLLIGASGVRSDDEGAHQFAAWFEAQGWQCHIATFPDHFLHFDTLFSMAADGLAVCCVDVVADETLDWLTSHGIELIPASFKEASRAATNLLPLGNDRVISPAENTEVNAQLRAHGIEVFDPNYQLFTMGGGSVRCTSMALHRAA
ncbi:MAG: amidinotransferase [Roseitalea sp.]|jgi:N-dimethylarginine dimethylaminohydrolase|nr:amidinotransferase [Roseitalea sp.]MBO6723186.1 amidinotransferase [Roseitalea sp.]MBO6745257.1 amidinotransferase [Roseitalea sp.]